MASLLILGLFVILLIIGLPIAFSLGIAGALLIYTQGGLPALSFVAAISWQEMTGFLLTAVPLFLFMGDVIFEAGIGSDLYSTARVWLGKLPGGLAVATIVSCTGFAAICGSSVATAASVGVVAYPEMKKYGYNSRFATGAIAAGGTLGILIPPSIPLIIYGMLTDVSVGKLFMAGIIPGMLVSGLFMAYAIVAAVLKPSLAPVTALNYSLKEKVYSLRKVWTVVVLIIFVLGGIYAGIVTPTEAAAVGAAVSLFLAAVVFRKVGWQTFGRVLVGTAQNTSMVMFIVIGALIFGSGMTLNGLTQKLAAYVGALAVPPILVLILINIFLLMLGCFLEVASILLITVPIFFPIAVTLGFDPVWFGIIYTINMELALITPPVGLNLFILQGVTEVPLGDIMRGTLPFVIVLVAGLALVIMFPQIVLWLPSRMGA